MLPTHFSRGLCLLLCTLLLLLSSCADAGGILFPEPDPSRSTPSTSEDPITDNRPEWITLTITAHVAGGFVGYSDDEVIEVGGEHGKKPTYFVGHTLNKSEIHPGDHVLVTYNTSDKIPMDNPDDADPFNYDYRIESVVSVMVLDNTENKPAVH